LEHLHDIGRRPALPEFGSHELHVGVDMLEEQPVAGTQIIEPPLTGRRSCESALRAFTVACEADFALLAVSRQGIALVQPEPALLL
jgi:hypothetical protein